MIYENIKLSLVSIFIYIPLVLCAFCFNHSATDIVVSWLFDDLFSFANFAGLYILILLPCIEIELCKVLIKYYYDSILIKLLSTWIIPILCLSFLFILDLIIILISHNIQLSASNKIDIHSIALFVSFAASFIPIFLTGIWYKIERKRNISNLFKLKYNLYAYPLIIITYWFLKFTGMLIVFFFETEFNYLGIF